MSTVDTAVALGRFIDSHKTLTVWDFFNEYQVKTDKLNYEGHDDIRQTVEAMQNAANSFSEGEEKFWSLLDLYYPGWDEVED